MTQDEFISVVGSENIISEDEMRDIEKKVKNGELVCLGGPTQLSCDFAKNPIKTPITIVMLNEVKRKHNI